MTDEAKGWAEKLAWRCFNTPLSYEQSVTKCLVAQHRRTLRILAKMEKQLQLDRHVYTESTKKHLMMLLAVVRQQVMKGRT